MELLEEVAVFLELPGQEGEVAFDEVLGQVHVGQLLELVGFSDPQDLLIVQLAVN